MGWMSRKAIARSSSCTMLTISSPPMIRQNTQLSSTMASSKCLFAQQLPDHIAGCAPGEPDCEEMSTADTGIASGSVAAILPLFLLEAVHAHDRPDEIL